MRTTLLATDTDAETLSDRAHNMSHQDILRRIARETGIADIETKLADSIATRDLHSVLLSVYRRKSESLTVTSLLDEYIRNPFLRPSGIDPRDYLEWDRCMFESLKAEFEPIELSPLSPLGSNSVLTPISQDKSLVTSKGLEVISDTSTVLALEAAARRRPAGVRRQPTHLAASHRLVRPHFRAHFRLFSLCSAVRAESAAFSIAALAGKHISSYLYALDNYLGEIRVRVSVTDLGEAPEPDALLAELKLHSGGLADRVDWSVDQGRTRGRGYYERMCFSIFLPGPDGPAEIGDGGFVDWTQQLLSDARERLLVSGLGSDRICAFKRSRAGQ